VPFVKGVADVNDPMTVELSSVAVVPVHAPVLVFQATLQLVTVNFKAFVVTLPVPSVIKDAVPV
jgi:hypothetical protein